MSDDLLIEYTEKFVGVITIEDAMRLTLRLNKQVDDASAEIERLRTERDRWSVVAERLYDIMLAHETASDDEWNQGLHECWLLMTGKTNEQTI